MLSRMCEGFYPLCEILCNMRLTVKQGPAESQDALRSPVEPHEIGEDFDGRETLLEESPGCAEVAAVHGQFFVGVGDLLLTVGAAVLMVDEVKLSDVVESTGYGELFLQKISVASDIGLDQAPGGPRHTDDVGAVFVQAFLDEKSPERSMKPEVHAEDKACTAAVSGHRVPPCWT
jgi:hypothetical protein